MRIPDLVAIKLLRHNFQIEFNRQVSALINFILALKNARTTIEKMYRNRTIFYSKTVKCIKFHEN